MYYNYYDIMRWDMTRSDCGVVWFRFHTLKTSGSIVLTEILHCTRNLYLSAYQYADFSHFAYYFSLEFCSNFFSYMVLPFHVSVLYYTQDICVCFNHFGFEYKVH